MNYRLTFLLGCLVATLPNQNSSAAEADVTLHRTQTIDLVKGWNAVYLEVEPAAPEPEKVFAGTPVDSAATYFPSKSSGEEFITDPEINLSKSKAWGVWYASEKPEAFLSSLGGIYGQQAYLVHAKSAFRWSIKGSVTPNLIKWRSDAYNLVGFGVRSTGTPTFAEFFAGSEAHKNQSIYRLVNGAWKKVSQPATESMRSGEAFWIYCKKSSTYQGPLGVELALQQGLQLSNGTGKIVLRNQTANPLTATVERVAVGGNELPVSIVMTVFGDPSKPVKAVAVEKPAGPWIQDFPPLEAGEALAIPLEARTQEMTAPEQGALLKITSDIGTESWVPVYGSRQSLNP